MHILHLSVFIICERPTMGRIDVCEIYAQIAQRRLGLKNNKVHTNKKECPSTSDAFQSLPYAPTSIMGTSRKATPPRQVRYGLKIRDRNTSESMTLFV